MYFSARIPRRDSFVLGGKPYLLLTRSTDHIQMEKTKLEDTFQLVQRYRNWCVQMMKFYSAIKTKEPHMQQLG
ncbi:hypothetical protein ACRRTK_002164 [Alexandromys fortis]